MCTKYKQSAKIKVLFELMLLKSPSQQLRSCRDAASILWEFTQHNDDIQQVLEI